MGAVLEIARPLRPQTNRMRFILSELKPKGPFLTPFNIVTSMLMAAAAVIITVRFVNGLGSVTNLSQRVPWGLWIGFDVMAGVALAGGAYVLTFLVYIMGLKQYHPIVRVTVLNGFLAYAFYTGALILDLGRPWNVVNPIIGNSFGLTSVLFMVAWHFLLYMIAELVEFSPAIAEWLGAERMRKILKRMTVATVIFGITLSTDHQAGLGALYLMAKDKVHPLWYSEFIPLLFFVSSIFAGLSMVIIEGSISHRVFFHRLSPKLIASHNGILFGLSRIAAGAMFVYLFLVALAFVHGQRWSHLNSGWGWWYLLEIVGLTAVPMVLFLRGVATRSLLWIRAASVMALTGIILNRLNISIFAFRWNDAVRYVPTWMEFVVLAGVLSAEIWVFRWIVLRMPVLGAERSEEHEVSQPQLERVSVR